MQRARTRPVLDLPHAPRRVVGQLRQAGIVASKRGAEGGYLLARPPADISLAEVIRAVEDLLRAEPRRAASAEEVSAALGVSPSALRAAVEASFGVDLDRYLRLRRLALARAALRSAEPRWASVEEVAAAHGFWDAAAFARQFRELFGEAPATASRRGAE